MRMLPSFITAVALAAVNVAAEPALDPAAALAQMKSLVAAGRFDEAVRVANPAVDAAERMADATTRGQALAALHFYAAVANSGSRNADDAREHLEEFFRLSPKVRKIDPARFEPAFVALFNDLSGADERTTANSFADAYSRFDAFVAPPQREIPAGTWGQVPALEILGTLREKQGWENASLQSERVAFINDFWLRRDPTPGTERNEFLETFETRVAFADRVFGSPMVRGSLTDRGKVFVLLGEPAYVRRRPLTRYDNVVTHGRVITMINGHIEKWGYLREQLPISYSRPHVMLSFVTQDGIGDGILQLNHAVALNALKVAANPNVK